MDKNKIGIVLDEFKKGTLKSSSGKKVTNPKQAIAIAISEAKKYNEFTKPLPIREAVFRTINNLTLEKFNQIDDELIIDVLDVMLFSVGTFNGITTTLEDLNDIVKNANEIGRVPIVKITHKDDALKDFGLYSIGEVDVGSLKVINGLLVGNLKILKWVVEFIYKGYLRAISVEIIHNLKLQDGRICKRVLDAVALLGSEREACWEKLKTYNEKTDKNVNELKSYDKIELYSYNEVTMEKEVEVKDTTDMPVQEAEVETSFNLDKFKSEIMSELKNYIGELITNMLNEKSQNYSEKTEDKQEVLEENTIVAKYEEDLNKLRNEVNKLREEKNRIENDVFIDGLIKSGKISPALKNKVSDLLSASFKASYSENNDLVVKIKDLLNSLENKVEYSEKEVGLSEGVNIDFSDYNNYYGRSKEEYIYEKINSEKAKKYSEEKGISFEEAVNIILLGE